MARFIFSWLVLVSLGLAAHPSEAAMPAPTSLIGRASVDVKSNSIVVESGSAEFAVESAAQEDAEISFRARSPAGTEQVQLWAGFRCRDRDSRYVFALRGGNDNDIYLARYAPDGQAKFLGFAPLDFKPKPNVWYRLRAVALGKQFQIYLNDEKLPRLNVIDADPLWTKGGVSLGGGWLPAEFSDLEIKPLSAEAKVAFLAISNQTWTAPPLDKESMRRNQRAEYKPSIMEPFEQERTEVSLDGNWLFMPDYELAEGQIPTTTDSDDSSWHVMAVPEFWTPGLSWLHGETGFPELSGVSRTKGVAESLYVQETQRCDQYTFDWRKTKSAWYRHHLTLPENTEGRHFILTFDAIAKVSEIWVNGTKVGAHTGMFGEIQCDITKAVRPGENVIAVHVTSAGDSGNRSPRKVEGVAVTVEVTSQMLHSLPHGMLQDDVGGIWQPVKLTITQPVFVSDCFIQPDLHHATLDMTVTNSTEKPVHLEVEYLIHSWPDKHLFYTSKETPKIDVAAGRAGQVQLKTPDLTPKLWSPEDPNLYALEVRLMDGGNLIDHYTTHFGFRTFETRGSQLYLNGRPYWLRGGCPFPNTLLPNDLAVARRFLQLAHDGNVCATRSHIVPFTGTWLDAADEIGVAVSYEGTWPWLMLRGEPPDTNLLQVWKDENLSLMRKYRNHPSLIMWTVNNEMKFESADAHDPPLLKKKWLILDDMIKAMRQTDPTRPIVADSSYVRKEAAKGYQTLVKPEGLDDGDIDDVHRYYGWYNESFFHLYDGKLGKDLSTPGRPLISQEMSTGYPNNDDGHPTRFYLFKNQTPQALVGDNAWENANPAIFLERQAFMTKELAETFRRANRQNMAGILHFSYFTWFAQPWSTENIQPWPAYYGLKTALQPVLVSAELFGRHFYTGTQIRRRVCIANDAEDLPAGRVTWEVFAGGQSLARGSAEVPSVKYYENHWQDVDFIMPPKLSAPRVDGELRLKLEAGGKVCSENRYDIVLATRDWANGSLSDDTNLALRAGNVWIATGTNGLNVKTVRDFVERGGRVLLLHPGAFLKKLYPDRIKAFVKKEGEMVSMHVPESPVFNGIGPLDIAWFERGSRRLPLACTGVYRIDSSQPGVTALATQCDLHGYLQKPSDIEKYAGAPLVEIRSGKGLLLASELCYEAGQVDPIARRLLRNAVEYLRKKQQ